MAAIRRVIRRAKRRTQLNGEYYPLMEMMHLLLQTAFWIIRAIITSMKTQYGRPAAMLIIRRINYSHLIPEL